MNLTMRETRLAKAQFEMRKANFVSEIDRKIQLLKNEIRNIRNQMTAYARELSSSDVPEPERTIYTANRDDLGRTERKKVRDLRIAEEQKKAEETTMKGDKFEDYMKNFEKLLKHPKVESVSFKKDKIHVHTVGLNLNPELYPRTESVPQGRADLARVKSGKGLSAERKKYYELGKFVIHLPLASRNVNDVRIFGKDFIAAGDSLFHWGVQTDGHVCWGDFEPELKNYLQGFDPFLVTDLAIHYLEEARDEHAYRRIDQVFSSRVPIEDPTTDMTLPQTLPLQTSDIVEGDYLRVERPEFVFPLWGELAQAKGAEDWEKGAVPEKGEIVRSPFADHFSTDWGNGILVKGEKRSYLMLVDGLSLMEDEDAIDALKGKEIALEAPKKKRKRKVTLDPASFAYTVDLPPEFN